MYTKLKSTIWVKFLFLFAFVVIVGSLAIYARAESNLVPLSCTDTDNGRDYYVAGYATSYVYGESKGDTYDSCEWKDGDTGDSLSGLYEVYCDNNAIASESIKCPDGCLNGACIQVNNSSCVDSDGGQNIFTKGLVYGHITPGETINQSDMCSSNGRVCSDWPNSEKCHKTSNWNGKNMKFLDEPFCKTSVATGSQDFDWATYECQYGCVDGACLTSPSSSPDLIITDIGIKLIAVGDESLKGQTGVDKSGYYYYVDLKNIGGGYAYNTWDKVSVRFTGQAGWMGATPGLGASGENTLGNIFGGAGNSMKANDTFTIVGPYAGNAYLGTYYIDATVNMNASLKIEDNTTNNSFDKSITISDINSVCGNGLIEPGEVCDKTNLDGQKCTIEGNLKCSANCKSFDHSGCLNGEDINPIICSADLTGYNYLSGFSSGETLAKIVGSGNETKMNSLINQVIAKYGNGTSNIPRTSKPLIGTCMWIGSYDNCYLLNKATGSMSNSSCSDITAVKAKMLEAIKGGKCCAGASATTKISTAVTCDGNLSNYNYLTGFTNGETLSSITQNDTKRNSLVRQVLSNKAQIAGLTGKNLTTNSVPSTNLPVIGKCRWLENINTGLYYIYSDKIKDKVPTSDDDFTSIEIFFAVDAMEAAIKGGYCCSAEEATKPDLMPTSFEVVSNSQRKVTEPYQYFDTLGFKYSWKNNSNTPIDKEFGYTVGYSINGEKKYGGFSDHVQSMDANGTASGEWKMKWEENDLSYGDELQFIFKVDSENSITESNENNNIFTETISFSTTTLDSIKCGNNKIDSGEICDGTNLNNETCQTKGYTDGVLRCSNNCISYSVIGCNGQKQETIKKTDSTATPATVQKARTVVDEAGKMVALQLQRKIETLEKQVVDLERKLSTVINQALTNRLKGKIILQTEANGEVWFVHPDTGARFYVKDGQAAYEILSGMGKGIKATDLEKIPLGYNAKLNEGLKDTDGDGLPDVLEQAIGSDINKADTDGDGFSDLEEYKTGYRLNQKNAKYAINTSFAGKLKGIYLDVDNRGAAWYINNGSRYYVSPENAYNVMKYLSLGISNDNLRQISVGEVLGSDDSLTEAQVKGIKVYDILSN